MYIVQYLRQVPPEEWEHDKLVRATCGDTVGMVLASKGMIPPK